VDALYYVVDPRVRLTLSTPRTRNPVLA
jgi:hypothetical protein